MSKTKMILAAVGGVSAVAIIAAGVFVWLQVSARTVAIEGDEETEGLEYVQSSADRLMRQPIRPCDESIRELTQAREELLAWKDETFRFAARGDRPIAKLSDAAFKEFLIRDAKRLQALPAGTTNKTLEASFEFGPFKPYIAEGKMPEREVLQTLQRNWDDLSLIIETLSACGISRVTAVTLEKAAEPKEETTAKNKKNKKSSKKMAAPVFKPASFTYTFTCLTRPAAFVKALNAFQASERFIAVDDFIIRRSKDTLSDALMGEKKDESATPSRRGGRRRGARSEEAETKADEPTIAVMTDPQNDLPFEAVLKLTVHDMRSLEEAPKEEDDK